MLSNKMKEQLTEKFKSFNTPEISSDNVYLDTDTDTDTENESSADETDTEEKVKEEPSFKNNYTHHIDSLNKVIPTKKYKTIRACVYKIITDEMYPFIMFLLYKYENNSLNFTIIDDFHTNNQDMVTHILSKFSQIFSEWDDVSFEYKGFVENNGDDVMVFLKYHSANKKTLRYVTYDTKWMWLLSAEIVNYKKVLTFDVNPFCTTFLLEHNKVMFLYNDTGMIYETPDVGYYGNYYKKIASVAILGLSRQNIQSSFGPYYYFSTYNHAMRNAIWNPRYEPMKILDEYITVDDRGRYSKGGIVKFALFTGKTKMLMGRSFDKPDESYISKELALTSEFVNLMLKLRDSGGEWTKEYNSIRIGTHQIKLKDKPMITTDPMVALKEYEQQVPLEYYYVDTEQGKNEEHVDKYTIL